VPSSLQATTSPSITAILQGKVSTAWRMPGKRFVNSLPFLEKMTTSSPALWSYQRYPSNFTSCSQASPFGGRTRREG